MFSRRLVLGFIYAVLALVFSFVFYRILTGGYPVISLETTTPLDAAISQTLPITKNGSVPEEGKDFKVTNSRYFEGNKWVVARFTSGGDSNNSAVVVLEKTPNGYQVVLGPGTSFSSSDVSNMPVELVTYMEEIGIGIYGND